MPADVLLAYLHPDNVSASFHSSLIDLIAHDANHDRRLAQWAKIECASGGIPEGRNQAVETLLSTDCEWLLFVDADMGFTGDILDQLLAVADPDDRPIVGGLCFAARKLGGDGRNGSRTYPQPTVFDFVDHGDGAGPRLTGRAHFPVNALTRCHGTGAAMLLTHRRVFEKLGDEYGPTWFDRFKDRTGQMLGEDIAFFNRVHACDFPVFVHTGARTTHAKTQWLGEDDYWIHTTPPPASETCAVIVPVKGRPDNAEPFMRSLLASTGLAHVYAVCDNGTDARAWREAGAHHVINQDGESFPVKANRGFAVTDEPWVLLVGDDVRFHAGWLDHVLWVADKYDRSVIATNDMANPRSINGEHATHPVISRRYIDEHGAGWDGPGVVCHEGYRHWYVDDEITTAAKLRQVFGAAPGARIEHLHPLVGKADLDATYELGLQSKDDDLALFQQRMAEAVDA